MYMESMGIKVEHLESETNRLQKEAKTSIFVTKEKDVFGILALLIP